MVINYPLNLLSFTWIKVKGIDLFNMIQPVFRQTIALLNMNMAWFVPLITEEEKAITIDQ